MRRVTISMEFELACAMRAIVKTRREDHDRWMRITADRRAEDSETERMLGTFGQQLSDIMAILDEQVRL